MGFKDCDSMNRLNAEKHLLSWIKRARKSKIKYMITAAKTIERTLGGLLNYLYNKETNTAVENEAVKLLVYHRSFLFLNLILFCIFIYAKFIY